MCELGLRLLEPAGHVHLAIHRHGSRGVLLTPLPVALACVMGSERGVTVRDERAHLEIARQGERLAVPALGQRLAALGLDPSREGCNSARGSMAADPTMLTPPLKYCALDRPVCWQRPAAQGAAGSPDVDRAFSSASTMRSAA